jgi:hypothetical protein
MDEKIKSYLIKRSYDVENPLGITLKKAAEIIVDEIGNDAPDRFPGMILFDCRTNIIVRSPGIANILFKPSLAIESGEKAGEVDIYDIRDLLKNEKASFCIEDKLKYSYPYYGIFLKSNLSKIEIKPDIRRKDKIKVLYIPKNKVAYYFSST